MKNKGKQFFRLLILPLVGAIILSLFPNLSVNAKDDDFKVDVKVGFGNTAEVGKFVPMYITVENNSKDFEGLVQMILPYNNEENNMYEQNVSIPAGTKKTICFVVQTTSADGRMNIRIANKKGKVIWNQEKRFSILTSLYNVNIGIFSDDYSALGYMDRIPFNGNSNFITKIFELNQDSFSSDWHALDMLDVIVISDYSTDLFTKEQIRSLTMWVNNGGLLMVGTGSTSSKTLSGLNHQLFEVTPKKLQSKQTMLGLSLQDFNYDYDYSGSYEDNGGYAYAEDDPEYMQFFEENYESYYEVFVAEFRESFCEWWGYEIDDEEWESDEIQQNFKDYCRDMFYPYYLNDKNSVNSGNELNSNYIYADVLQMTVEDEEYVIVGDTANGDTFDLNHLVKKGEGYILISGIDFTKNPIPGYEYSSLFVVDLIESVIGAKVSKEANQYQYGFYQVNGISYSERKYLNKVATAPTPPILLYGLIGGLFLITIIAMYFIFLHKKKTFKLWFWYPVISIGVLLLVYCVGFSTRLVRPVLSADRFLRFEDNAYYEKDYTAFTVSRTKTYRIPILNNYQMTQNRDDSYYSIASNQDPRDMNVYSRAYNVSGNAFELVLNNLVALESEKLILDSLQYTEKNILIEGNSDYSLKSEDIAVTNSLGTDLEKVLVIVDDGANYNFYYMGDIKNSEKVLLKDAKSKDQKAGCSWYSCRDLVFPKEERNIMTSVGFFLGSLSGKFNEYKQQYRMMDMAFDLLNVNTHTDGNVYVIGFPKTSIADEIQEENHYSENFMELVYKKVHINQNII